MRATGFLILGDDGGLLTSAGSLFVTERGGAWRQQPAITKANLRSVAFGVGRFVAVGRGQVFRSSDANRWVESKIATNALNAVTFANGTFLAVGDYGTIFRSPDGQAWSSSGAGTTQNVQCVTFGGGRYLVGGALE